MIKLKSYWSILFLVFYAYSGDLDEEIVNNLEFVESLDLIEKSEEYELKNLGQKEVIMLIEEEKNGDQT
ncbi:MAG: hypothetical protein A2381_02130 [Bdellovibrionales bacterium RIFOXYB1_FULL_37_110]|nr:MAG: hypothetical protein A2417_13435 [Bdellovibrionales bacterium RIFOXYC1_FULL_37_79]OFZ59238.1 MAG: hypothetical protein A2381_02130 [Bdellovibrionales bacterium RIFOXYB1_FULL_37_110]OFZ62864.1 MAG: hypothetical protein A2577_11085 [Bdellovibrionales bacterium RIFOXYD1_FULL_36_51]